MRDENELSSFRPGNVSINSRQANGVYFLQKSPPLFFKNNFVPQTLYMFSRSGTCFYKVLSAKLGKLNNFMGKQMNFKNKYKK